MDIRTPLFNAEKLYAEHRELKNQNKENKKKF
jgi:hypothetical protein